MAWVSEVVDWLTGEDNGDKRDRTKRRVWHPEPEDDEEDGSSSRMSRKEKKKKNLRSSYLSRRNELLRSFVDDYDVVLDIGYKAWKEDNPAQILSAIREALRKTSSADESEIEKLDQRENHLDDQLDKLENLREELEEEIS